jgi:micrococcal nuclease
LREGDILQISADGRRLSALADSGGLKAESYLYTYDAYVTSVVDGDSFHAVLDLGFGFVTHQRVRLMRIDAPEIISADGKKAKKALEKVLMKNGGKILIQSKELDQHGRPIGNVFIDEKSIDSKLLKSNFFTTRNST